jgi:hypothetical protein
VHLDNGFDVVYSLENLCRESEFTSLGHKLAHLPEQLCIGTVNLSDRVGDPEAFIA